ncbi:MAG: GtrA family protein [Anaerolineales bacterium]|nr:GtrA family protein [Anaerolineales bacterium]
MTILTLRKTPELTRFLRFLAVGALGTLLDFGLLTTLKRAGVPTLAANTLSFSAGVINNFVLNRRWTFGDAPQSRWTAQFVPFALVSLVGLVLNSGIVLLLEVPFGTLLGGSEWGYLPAKALATGVVVFWNYCANRLWTFRPQDGQRPKNFEGIL